MNTEKIEATPCRIVVLNVLRNGPSTWRDIRIAYYGPVRSQSKSNTSFQNQLGRMIDKGLIKKEDGHYEITSLGREMIESLTPEAIEGAKSKAHTMAEVK
jgi:predicted transcriptional regulator